MHHGDSHLPHIIRMADAEETWLVPPSGSWANADCPSGDGQNLAALGCSVCNALSPKCTWAGGYTRAQGTVGLICDILKGKAAP